MKQDHKKLGWGSLSILLFLIGILFSYSFDNRAPYGDNILRLIGLNPWSNGDKGLHYTIFYSLIFYVTALILGYKYKNDFGAKIGKFLSFIMIIFILLLFLLLVSV